MFAVIVSKAADFKTFPNYSHHAPTSIGYKLLEAVAYHHENETD